MNENLAQKGNSSDDKHLIAKAIEYITGYAVDTNTIQHEANNVAFKYRNKEVWSTLSTKLIDDTIRMHEKSLRGRFAKGGETGFDDSDTTLLLYHEKKGNFMIPKNQIYLWLYEGKGINEKLNNGEYDWVFYPLASINMSFSKDFVPPLKKIWTKKFQKTNKGSDKLLGVIKAYLLNDGTELYIDMMSTNPAKKKSGIMSYMIQDLRNTFNLTQDQITFSKLTPEGEKFVAKKTYADGGNIEEIKTKYQIAGSDKNGVYTYSKRVADEIAEIYGGNVEEDGSKWYVKLGYKYADGGDTEQVYIEFLNKEKGFKKDTKYFNSYEEAVEWARENFEKFNPDMIKYKYANGGGLEGNSNRNETQENNFGVSYKLGDKFTLGRKFGNKDEEVFITEIMPSGLFFKVDKSSKIFSIKTLHSRGSTYTSGEYLVPIKKEYSNGGGFEKKAEIILTDDDLGYFSVLDLEKDEFVEKDFTNIIDAIDWAKENGYKVQSLYKYADGGSVGYDVNDVVQLKNIPENYPYEIRNGIVDNKWKIVRVSKSGRSMYSDIMEDIFGYDIELLDTKMKYKAFVYPEEVKPYIKYAKGGSMYADGGDVPHEDKMFQLPLEMVIYVPSTQDVDKVISVDKMDKRVDEVKEYLASKFGGYTSSDKLGGYVDSNGNLVNEDVVQITSFSTKEAFEENKKELIQQIAKWGKDWGQEAIGFEFEGDLMYVPQEL